MFNSFERGTQLGVPPIQDPFYIQSDISDIVKQELGAENSELAFILSDKLKEWIENVYYQIMNEANANIYQAVRDCEENFYNELQILHSNLLTDIDNKFSQCEDRFQKDMEHAVLVAKGQEDPNPDVATSIINMMFEDENNAT